MRDLFDDFLEELRRREAVARGEDPDAGAPKRANRVGPDPVEDPSPDDDVPDPDRAPRDFRSGRSGGGSGRGRGVGGPRDGAGRRRGRRLTTWLLAGIVLAIVILFAFG